MTAVYDYILDTDALSGTASHGVARAVIAAGAPVTHFHRGERDKKKGSLADAQSFNVFLDEQVRAGGLYLSSRSLLVDISPDMRDRSVKVTLWPRAARTVVEDEFLDMLSWFPAEATRLARACLFEERKARNRFSVKVGVSTHEFWLPRTTRHGWLPGPVWRTFWSTRLVDSSALAIEAIPPDFGPIPHDNGVILAPFERPDDWVEHVARLEAASADMPQVITVQKLGCKVAELSDAAMLRSFRAKYE